MLVLGACSASGGLSNLREGTDSRSLPPPAKRNTASPIQHVVFIIQENRSFNNLFMGYPGAKTQRYGYDTTGAKIVLRSQGLAQDWDIEHFSQAFFAACDSQKSLPGTHCKMDGWNNEGAGIGSPTNYAYAYVPLGYCQTVRAG